MVNGSGRIPVTPGWRVPPRTDSDTSVRPAIPQTAPTLQVQPNQNYKYEHKKEHLKIIHERKSNFNFNRYLYSYLFSFLQILTKMTSCRRERKPARPSHRNKSRSWKNDTSLKSTSLPTSARRWPRHWDSQTNR